MARYLYSELAALVQARRNCIERMERENPNAVTASTTMEQNEHHRLAEWRDKHEDAAVALVKEFLPSGSGFDSGTSLDFDASHGEKLVFVTAFRHMNEGGFYDGWTEHTVTATPSFSGFHLRISGRNRNDIKEYIGECFHHALNTELTVKVGA